MRTSACCTHAPRCHKAASNAAVFDATPPCSYRTLDLSSNQLRGGLPPELGALSRLVAVNLGGNSFSGTVPMALLSRWPVMQELHLEANQFEGSLNGELCDAMPHLGYLGLRGNRFEGPLRLSNCYNLTALFVEFNRLNKYILCFQFPPRNEKTCVC